MTDSVYNLLLSKMKQYAVDCYTDKSFSQLTTLGSGGTIKLTAYPDSTKKLVRVVRLLDRLAVPYCVLGKGSNVLASDDEYDGVVVCTSRLSDVKLRGNKVVALCGASTVTIANLLKDKGLSGGEFLACLPASIGGAVVGNAGCFGQDVKGVVVGVTALHNGKIRHLSTKACSFSKRNSIFKRVDGYTILSVKMKFSKSTTEAVVNKISEMRKIKADTQPLNYRSAGCVLYHDSVAVSRLTDMAGLKGYTVGGAQVSNKHAGFVLNIDKATSKDIYLVIQHIRKTLWQQFGVQAKMEVRLINFTKDYDDIFSKR